MKRIPSAAILSRWGRSSGHNAPLVSADVEPTDVIGHDDDDVGLLGLRRSHRRGDDQLQDYHRAKQCRAALPVTCLYRLNKRGSGV